MNGATAVASNETGGAAKGGGVARRSLFDIGADWLALDMLLDDLGGDVSDPQVDSAVSAMMAELQADEAAKLDGWVAWLKQLEMEAAAARAESELWRAKAAVREGRAAWVKERLKGHLQATGRTKVVTAKGVGVAVVANGGKVPVEIDAVAWDEVPEQFRTTVVTVDKAAVARALEGGEVLTFARLGVKGSHLRVK